MELGLDGLRKGQIVFEGVEGDGFFGVVDGIAEGAQVIDGGGVGDGFYEGINAVGMAGADATEDLEVIGAELEVDVLDEIFSRSAIESDGITGGTEYCTEDYLVKSRKKSIPSVEFSGLRGRQQGDELFGRQKLTLYHPQMGGTRKILHHLWRVER